MAIIEMEEIGKRYRLGDVAVDALRDVSLKIAIGESVAIVGPSGSGKSTLLGILGALDPPTMGRYRLASEDVSSLSNQQLAALRSLRIGFVFQGFNLLARLDAVENVALALAYAGVPGQHRLARATAMLERVGLGDRLNHLPSQLSGGQQQRVAIARALVNNPDIILADEPTGALDTSTGSQVLLLLREFTRENKALVVITHDPAVASTMERTISLRDGLVEADRAALPAADLPDAFTCHLRRSVASQ